MSGLDGLLSQLNSLTEADIDEDFDYDEEEEEEEDYVDAEAEEIAKRLNDELTAQIAKAAAEIAAAAAPAPAARTSGLALPTTSGLALPTSGLTLPTASGFALPASGLALPTSGATPSANGLALPTSTGSPSVKKEAAVIATMRAVLLYASKDPLVSFTLASASVIDASGSRSNAFQILQRSVEAGFIPKELAKPLSQVIVSLAKSETLFASLKHSNAPAVLLDKGKRKRGEEEPSSPSKRLASDYWVDRLSSETEQNLLGQVKPAVHVITESLSAASLSDTSAPTSPLDPALISSLQAPLHQVFLFAVTTAPSSAQNSALQEIGGLIQMLGVLSGIHIGPNQIPPSHDSSEHYPDLSTAVYPCLLPSCQKTFSRLYFLRSHQRSHSSHPSIRPYRCLQCPASFARNHDLKRHLKLHGSKAFKCSGCEKVFSRRDAIKRHMNSNRAKTDSAPMFNTLPMMPAERCRNAEVIEVDVDKEDDEEGVREERRAKIWEDRMASVSSSDYPQGEIPLPDDSPMEEGEIPTPIIAEAQHLVLSLFELLSGYVAKYAPSTEAAGAPHDSSKTVASIMASQNWARSETMGDNLTSDPPLPSLSLSWLSPDQTRQLEEAIAAAAKAAQEQAEAEAAWEEEEEEDGDGERNGE